MHPRYTKDVAHPGRRIRGLQLGVEGVVVAQEYRLQDLKLVTAHARVYVYARQAVASLLRERLQPVGRPVPDPLPRTVPHEAGKVDAAPPHVALVVEGVGVAGRRDAGKAGVDKQQVAVAQSLGHGRGLEIEQHLPDNRASVSGLQNFSLHLQAPLARGRLRRDTH